MRLIVGKHFLNRAECRATNSSGGALAIGISAPDVTSNQLDVLEHETGATLPEGKNCSSGSREPDDDGMLIPRRAENMANMSLGS